MTPEANSAPPSIPDYELLKLVGRGAYGDVWLARGVTGVFRAIKLVWRERFNDAQPYEREFKGLKEFAAISLLEARQLALLHVGRQDAAGFFYYVMELADDAETGREIEPGRYTPLTLHVMRRRSGRLPAADVLSLAVELSRALAGLHSRGLVHRDVKPSNVIIVGGVPKLADIGLVTSATGAHTFVGTEGYVPPEGPGAPSADVYSLGKLLYELATGLDRQEFPRLPPDLHTWPDRKLLLELNEVVLRACERAPERRQTDAGILSEELLLLQAGKSVRRLRATERQLSRALRIAIGLTVLAGIAGAGAFVERQRANEELRRRERAEAERDELARKTVYTATLARAQRALETGDYGRARLALQAAISATSGLADLRGFEWHALWREAQGSSARILREQGPAMKRVCLSPNGAFVASLSAEYSVELRETASGRHVRTVPGIFALAGFSGDGRHLIGANLQAELQSWSVDDGQPSPHASRGIHRPLGMAGARQGLSFLEGEDLAPHRVARWDFPTGTALATWALPMTSGQPRRDFYRSALTGDGRRVAFSLIQGRAQEARWHLVVHATENGEPLFHEATPHRLTALCFSPDGAQLAVAFGDTAEVGLLDLATGRWQWRTQVGAAQTNTLAFSADGQHLATGGRDAVVRVLSVADHRIERTLRGHGGGIEDLQWLSDGDELLSCSTAGEVRLWTLDTPTPPVEFGGLWRPAGGGRRLCLSPDGRWLAASDTPEKGAVILDTASGQIVARFPQCWLPLSVSAEAFHGLCSDGRLQSWSLADPARPQPLGMIATLAAEHGPVSYAGATARSSGFIVGSSRGFVSLGSWTPAVESPPPTEALGDGMIMIAAAAPDGARFVAAGSDRPRAQLLDSRGRHIAFLVGPAQPLAAAFAPDRAELALGLADGAIELRDSANGRLLRRIVTGSPRIQSLVYTPDGRRLLGGAPQGALHVIDPRDGHELASFYVPPLPDGGSDTSISDLAFSADESMLAAYANDGRIRLWRR